MRLPDDPNKFTSRFKYVELGRIIPSDNPEERDGFTREKRNNRTTLHEVSRIPEYIAKYETGLYCSVYQYDRSDFDSATYLGPVHFDIDSPDLEQSRADTHRLVEHLLTYIPRGAIRVYFSGSKGFHVECEPITLGISPSDELPGVSRFIAEHLAGQLGIGTFDYGVYDERRMWRLPGSRNQRTGLFKVPCMQMLLDGESIGSIVEYAKEPHIEEVPEQAFDYHANQWYREYVYQYEQSRIKRKEYSPDMVANFLASGTSNIKHYDGDKIFDRANLLRNCSAVRELDRKAREQHHLDHYERLFLCSLLTYNDEAILYLHELLSKLDDYRFEISNAHIQDWIRRREYGIGGRPFTCQKAREVGVTCADCDKMEPRKKHVPLDGGGYLEVEEMSLPSPIRYAYHTKRG